MWQNKYNNIILSEHLENNLREPLLKFMKKFVIPDIKLVEDPVLTEGLNLVGGYQHLLITFDIEFQNAIINSNLYYSDKTIFGDNTSSFIREFGGIIFLKSEGKWYYLGKMLFNFNDISRHKINKKNIRLIHSKYSTVTENTKSKMIENEKVFNILEFSNKDIIKNWLFNRFYDGNERKFIVGLLSKNKLTEQENTQLNRKLQNIGFNLFGTYLNKWYSGKIDEQHKIYYSDNLVKQRMVTIKDEHKFFDLFSILSKYTYFVVKGKRDIEAIKNSQMLIKNNKIIHFDSIYDIEIFNKMSQNIYGNAQLETTFNGLIKSTIYKDHMAAFFDDLLSGIAHNPMTDSVWTIIVAICIALGANIYFSDGKNYTKEYEKYKKKYMEIKNQNRRMFGQIIN